MENLNGRVAVITGGASGIGLATARLFAREGMRIVLADVEAAALATAVAEITALGTETIGVQTDVGDLAQVRALADRTYERFGSAHVVFNNAGVAIFGPIQDMRHEDWEWVLRVDLWGVIHGVEAFVPRMIAGGEGGHVVNTASFAGLVANSGLGAYCVAKYGVVGLSECLYRDVSAHGIGVSVLCPMIVATRIGSSERNRPAELGGPTTPMVPTPEEEASLAGGTLSAAAVAEHVVRGIKRGDLYILTHPESRTFIRRRFERIDRAFGGD
jgi:NAD(P)-dependent dehydrogenase (short-subunit alcohol dehydrogenase family)